MISVRYCHWRDLSPGLNATAQCNRRGTVVYLVPGLTRDERRAALRRLRMASRIGAGPELPAAQLAFALLADRIRTVAGRAGAIVRVHPAASALPVLLVSVGVIVFLSLSAVSVQVLPQQAAGPSPLLAPGPAATAGGHAHRPHRATPVNLIRSDPPPPGHTRHESGGSGSGQGGQGNGRQPTISGSASPAPTSPPATGQPSPGPAPTPTPTPTPSASPPAPRGGACLKVGPLGVCLSL
jgi:hypothetical protein